MRLVSDFELSKMPALAGLLAADIRVTLADAAALYRWVRLNEWATEGAVAAAFAAFGPQRLGRACELLAQSGRIVEVDIDAADLPSADLAGIRAELGRLADEAEDVTEILEP